MQKKYTKSPTEVVKGDLNNLNSLARAVEVVDGSHLAYSAGEKAGTLFYESKFGIEEHVRSTGIPLTILPPIFFMDNGRNKNDRPDHQDNVLPLRPETLQVLGVDNIGSFVAKAFGHPGRWASRTDFAGLEQL